MRATSLEEIEAIASEVLVAEDIVGVLHIDAQDIRRQIQEDKKAKTNSFWFPVTFVGCRIKISIIPFLKYMRGE